MSEVFTGDVGTEIEVDCGVDVSTATVRKLKVRRPNGTQVEWAASAKGTTKISYVVADGDLSMPGVWQIQAYIEMPGWKGRGGIAKLEVKA